MFKKSHPGHFVLKNKQIHDNNLDDINIYTCLCLSNIHVHILSIDCILLNAKLGAIQICTFIFYSCHIVSHRARSKYKYWCVLIISLDLYVWTPVNILHIACTNASGSILCTILFWIIYSSKEVEVEGAIVPFADIADVLDNAKLFRAISSTAIRYNRHFREI